MPKIRDLGINAIPLTMQPPEIGDGGGGGDDARWTGTRIRCEDDADQVRDTWTGSVAACEDTGPPAKPPADPAWTGLGECTGNPGKKTAGLSPEAFAEVRQQIAKQSATF